METNEDMATLTDGERGLEPSPLRNRYTSSKAEGNPPKQGKVDPLELLLSDEETVRQVRVTDKASVPQGARVECQPLE